MIVKEFAGAFRTTKECAREPRNNDRLRNVKDSNSLKKLSPGGWGDAIENLSVNEKIPLHRGLKIKYYFATITPM
jgi:hypothetical protein